MWSFLDYVRTSTKFYSSSIVIFQLRAKLWHHHIYNPEKGIIFT